MANILIIEDEISIAEPLIMNLEASGHKTFHASDGKAGLEFFRGNQVDLILLDLMLPEIDGHSVLKEVRKGDERIPVLVITARDENIEKMKLFRSGVDDYLCKPFALNELMARVERLLLRSSWEKDTELEDSFEFDSRVINFEQMKATIGERQIELTEQEVKILAYFARHPGEIVKRETLLKDVLGYESVIETRTIDNFIVRFRKYFEDNPKAPRYFQSHRGVGYSFHPRAKDEV